MLSWIANQFVFYPSRYPDGWWHLQSRLHASDVWLNTADGVKIHSWLVRTPGARLITLFFHGNAGNITHRQAHVLDIQSAGSSVLLMDYRGYGKSAGSPSESGLYRDADAAWQYLHQSGYKPEEIVLHGESLGTGVAVDLASRQRCAGIILEAPFPSIQAVAQTVVPLIGPLFVRGFDSASKIRNVQAPILIIQGDRDEVIPLRLGQALFDAAPDPKSFWLVPGAGHNDILETAGIAYRHRLQAFYAKLNSTSV